MNNNILNDNYDELRVIKSGNLPAKIAAYLVSIDWLLCLAFFYGWHFFKKISLDWPLTLTTQQSTSKLSHNSVNYTDYSLQASSLGCYGSAVIEGRSACNYVSEIGKSVVKKSMGNLCWLVEMALSLACIAPMFVYIHTHFCFALIRRNLKARSKRSHRGIGGGVQIPET